MIGSNTTLQRGFGIRHSVWLCFCIIILTGCEETVEPNLGTDLPYTLWGIIDAKADTHAVRVFEVVPTIRFVEPDPLDMVFTSTEMETGMQRVWKDSVIQLLDGDYRHVFWADFEPKHEHTYRLEARRSDGIATHVEVTVPPEVTLEVQEPNLNQINEIIVSVLIRGEPPALPKVTLEYHVRAGRVSVMHRAVLPYEGVARPIEGGYLVDINLIADLGIVRSDLLDRYLPIDRIELLDMTLRVHVGNAGWESPVGIFDPNVLVEPGLLSNVENGFGYVGAGYVETINWKPPSILLARAGWDVD